MIDALLGLFGATPVPASSPAPASSTFGSLLDAILTTQPSETTAAGDGALANGSRLSGLVAATPDPDMAKLSPELRSRLARVMARMSAEHGHDVRVVEGLRSGARQEYLYAQGRERPGPVVTWTRESRHESGRAADLIVDGSYDNAEAYRTLQRVAREEGLHTLGMTDPGHVELTGVSQDGRERAAHGGTVPPGAEGLAAGLAAARTAAAPSRIASSARPVARARTAATAAPATPAVVARVATPATAGTRAVRRARSGDGRAAGSVAPAVGHPAGRGEPRHPAPGAGAEAAAPATDLLSGDTPRAFGTRGNGAELPIAATGEGFQPPQRPAMSAPAPGVVRSPLTSAIVGSAHGGEPDARGRSRSAVSLEGAEEVEGVVEVRSTDSRTPRTHRAPLATQAAAELTGANGSLNTGLRARRSPRHEPVRAEGDTEEHVRPGEATDRGVSREAAHDTTPIAAPRHQMEPTRPDADGLRAPRVRPLEPVQPGARIDAIDALREQARSQPLHRVSLRVGEGADAARVRVDLRGDRVQAEMATDSDRLATRLRHETPELGRTLERQGIEVDALRVRQGDRVVPEAVVMRSVEASRSSDRESSQRDRDGSAQGQHEHGRERPRRERDQEKNQ